MTPLAYWLWAIERRRIEREREREAERIRREREAAEKFDWECRL